MNEADYRALLERNLQGEPALSAGEIDTLVDGAALPDLSGVERGDELWIPTWRDEHEVIAEGWSLKMAKVSGDFDLSADGSSVHLGQVLKNCELMRDMHLTMVRPASISLRPARAPRFPVVWG